MCCTAPMPPGSLTVRGLLRFGLQGSGRDLVRLLLFSLVAGLGSLALPIATGAILGTLVPVGQTVSGAGRVAAAAAGGVRHHWLPAVPLRRPAAAAGPDAHPNAVRAVDRLIALPVQFFGRFSVADLTLRVNGVDAIQQIVASVASQTLLAVVTLVFSLGLLFFYSVGLAVAVLIVTMIIVSVSAVITMAQIRRLRAMYDAKGAASAVSCCRSCRALTRSGRPPPRTAHWAPGRPGSRTRPATCCPRNGSSALRTAIYAMLPSFLDGDRLRRGVREPGHARPPQPFWPSSRRWARSPEPPRNSISAWGTR